MSISQLGDCHGKNYKNTLFFSLFFSLIILSFSTALADDDDHHDDKKWYKKIFADKPSHGSQHCGKQSGVLIKDNIQYC